MTKLILAALLGAASMAHAADLTIVIDGVANADGQIMIALYSGGDNFLGKPLRALAVPAAAGAMQVKVADLPAGDYAFAIYHDANSNGKMDRNAMGMPTEDYAFSNNALGKRSAPRYEDARFAVSAAGATASVSLR